MKMRSSYYFSRTILTFFQSLLFIYILILAHVMLFVKIVGEKTDLEVLNDFSMFPLRGGTTVHDNFYQMNDIFTLAKKRSRRDCRSF